MTGNQLIKHQDALINDIIDTARGYRAHHFLDFDAPVGIKVNEGIRSRLTARDLQQLDFMGIAIESKDN